MLANDATRSAYPHLEATRTYLQPDAAPMDPATIGSDEVLLHLTRDAHAQPEALLAKPFLTIGASIEPPSIMDQPTER